jgi:putative methylase
MENKSNLKILVNSPDFKDPDPKLEQYATPVDTTLEIIKKANSRGHLSGKVADLGCGTGRLAIGAAIQGADVTGFEIDAKALDIAIQYSRENNLDIKWICSAVENINEEFNTIIMNPPFGSQRPGADRIFLEKAIEIADNIWTIHMAETRNFVEKFVGNRSAKIESCYEFDFAIPKSMTFHTRDLANQKAILYHIASLR